MKLHGRISLSESGPWRAARGRQPRGWHLPRPVISQYSQSGFAG
ncbi:hypothetical protein BV133_2631 [Blastochloris viridis]|uniref:Uncharacterized protein n=1 Tax=Blastochloris viridis TaxID=1079 RepID=A0A182D482_BLAVI|nr:hypothetical protein BV133_2631 [Blastochloris viridis]